MAGATRCIARDFVIAVEMSHNTWIHRIVRTAVRPLARTRVTPNQVTCLRLFTGVAAAGLLAMGVSPWAAIGAGVFALSMLLDRADGELARMTGKHSPGGHRFDLFADAFSNALAFVAIGIGLRDGTSLGYWAIPMGAVAGISIMLNLWFVMAMEEMKGARSAELKSFWGFDADDATLLLPIFVWLGWTVPLTVMAFICAPIFTALAARHFTKLHRLDRSPFADLIQPRPAGPREQPVLQPVDRRRPQSSGS
jgi:phosphatidylglycerophosphate synthase